MDGLCVLEAVMYAIGYEICCLLEYYSSLSGSSVPTFRDNLSVPSSRVKKFFLNLLTLEDGTGRLSRNVSAKLLLNAA
jgi:hypothetical protein